MQGRYSFVWFLATIALGQIEKTAQGGLFYLVEMMGIEPMSENPLTQLSPWAVCYLEFPVSGANKHAPRLGSPFLHDRFKSEQPMHVHRCDDAQSSVAVVRGGTGGPQATAPPIGIPYGMSIRQP